MSELFGWDLIYKLSENDLKKKEDVLTLFVHYILIKGGYKCIGLGDDKVFTGNEVSSETLPPEWNNNGTYSIRYFLNNQLYILKGIPVESNIVYNLLDASNMKVTNVAFNVETTVGAIKGDLSTLIPTHEEVLKKIQSDLVAMMGNGNTKEATTQASEPMEQQQQQQQQQRTNETFGPHHPHPFAGPRLLDPDRDPLRVGGSDLDPWGGPLGGFGGGGGMLFNPPRAPLLDPSHFPGPSLPRVPGARFDPLYPPFPRDPRPRRPPGSDFNPPGFDDFM